MKVKSLVEHVIDNNIFNNQLILYCINYIHKKLYLCKS